MRICVCVYFDLQYSKTWASIPVRLLTGHGSFHVWASVFLIHIVVGLNKVRSQVSNTHKAIIIMITMCIIIIVVVIISWLSWSMEWGESESPSLLAWATCSEPGGQVGQKKYPWRNSLRWGWGRGEVGKRIRSHEIWWEREFLGQVNINVILQQGQREQNLEKKPLGWVTDSSQQIFPNSLPDTLLAIRDTTMARNPLRMTKRGGTEGRFQGEGRWWDSGAGNSKLSI